MREIAYVDVLRTKDGKTLVIANDERHNELWRRDDPEAERSAMHFIRAGKTPVYDHRDGRRFNITPNTAQQKPTK